MMNHSRPKSAVCGAFILAASGASGQGLESEMRDHVQVTSLKGSIEPLRDHFNAEAQGRRFIAILSSTCQLCIAGAQAVQESVLDAYPDAALSVTIIWVDMLRADGEAAASKSAQIFDDVRVTQFYDPTFRSSKVFAKDVLHADGGPAWDMYLYYEPGATWDAAPPKPEEWYHQLSGGKRGDPNLFRTGRALFDQLRESTGGFIERWNRVGESFSPAKDLQLLTFEGCPNSAAMTASLSDALERLGEQRHWEAVDLAALAPENELLHFGSPTLLVRGRDIFGESPQPDGQLMCRLYSDGVPSSEVIESRLRELIGGINAQAIDGSSESRDP
jgi:hypothetical protein